MIAEIIPSSRPMIADAMSAIIKIFFSLEVIFHLKIRNNLNAHSGLS